MKRNAGCAVRRFAGWKSD